MEKNIKDYLGFYIGCEIDTNIQGQYIHPYGCIQLKDLTPENLYRILDRIDLDAKNKEKWNEESDHYCKLILRPLSDMTEEEYYELEKLNEDETVIEVRNGKFELDFRPVIASTTKRMLDMGFDLFGLITAGLAIDKSNY